MTGGELIGRVTKRHPAASRVLRAWRELTDGGEPTLVACSGGADSSALAICLCASPQAGAGLTLAYVMHPMRPREEIEGEGERVRELAEGLGAGFVLLEIERGDGNEEGHAREARYSALAGCARDRGLRWIATGHHADDQLETLLMGLIRGSGPDGLSGVRERRVLEGRPEVLVVRAMLGVSRAEARTVCEDAGWSWCEDPTNEDRTRVRARLRAEVTPILEAIRPGVSARAARSARLIGEAAQLVASGADALLDGGESDGGALVLRREALRTIEPIVIGAAVRRGARRVAGDAGMDGLGGTQMDAIVGAIRSKSGERREFGAGGARIEVTRDAVRIEASAS